MATLALILLVAALVLSILAGLGVPSPPRMNFVGWALACYFASLLIVRAV